MADGGGWEKQAEKKKKLELSNFIGEGVGEGEEGDGGINKVEEKEKEEEEEEKDELPFACFIIEGVQAASSNGVHSLFLRKVHNDPWQR